MDRPPISGLLAEVCVVCSGDAGIPKTLLKSLGKEGVVDSGFDGSVCAIDPRLFELPSGEVELCMRGIPPRSLLTPMAGCSGKTGDADDGTGDGSGVKVGITGTAP